MATVTTVGTTSGYNINISDVTTMADIQMISGPQIYSLEHLVVTTITLGLMILCTIIGNVFVIAAIILEKNLHNVANYLILSLAVADLMVASIVMPISVVKEVRTVGFTSISCKFRNFSEGFIFAKPQSFENKTLPKWRITVYQCK